MTEIVLQPPMTVERPTAIALPHEAVLGAAAAFGVRANAQSENDVDGLVSITRASEDELSPPKSGNRLHRSVAASAIAVTAVAALTACGANSKGGIGSGPDIGDVVECDTVGKKDSLDKNIAVNSEPIQVQVRREIAEGQTEKIIIGTLKRKVTKRKNSGGGTTRSTSYAYSSGGKWVPLTKRGVVLKDYKVFRSGNDAKVTCKRSDNK